MQRIITQDGSITFKNEKYDETYHSISGALEEAFEKFAKPCNLRDGMDVLDICFGLGYNTLAAISMVNVNVIALENDPMILKTIRNITIKNDSIININNFNQLSVNKIKNNKLSNNYEKIKIAANKLEYNDDKTKIKIILGDALETVRKLNLTFDAVFLDPFSLKKCPELWTHEFFKDIRAKMKKASILATYSCSKKVRNNLRNAGFELKDGPIIGRKSPGTLAYPQYF